MNIKEIFELIMDFESRNLKELMKFKINDIHLYPVYRYNILFEIFRKATKIQKPHAGFKQEKFWFVDFLNSLVKSYLRNVKIQKSILSSDAIAISTYALRRKKVENKEFDVIYDYFLPEITNNHLLIENAFRMKVSKKPYTKNVYYPLFDSFKAKINIFKNRLSEEQKRILKEFSYVVYESIKNFFGDIPPVFLQEIQGVLFKFNYSYEYASKLVKLVKSLSPKLLFVHCGSYGGTSAIIIKLCKQNDIKIAEIQHGVVNKFHLAYNYGFNNTEYREYLPDYFLTWGRYWSEQLERLPVEKITIGFPEFINNYMNHIKRENIKNSNEKIILVVSQGIVTKRLVKIAEELSKKLPDNFKILYKLHPGEIPFEERYKELYSLKNVKIIKFGNIYEYITKADFIIAYNSTTIFEALPFEKPLFILDDELSDMYIPKEIGIRFNRVDDIIKNILNNSNISNNSKEINWHYYWELDWKSNLENFIKKLF